MRRMAWRLALGVTGLALALPTAGCAGKPLQSPLAFLQPKSATTQAPAATQTVQKTTPVSKSPSGSKGLLSKFTEAQPTSVAKTNAAKNTDSSQWLEQAAQAEIGGRLKEARDLYSKICQAEPDHALARHRLAVVTTQLDDFSTAWMHYQVALQLAPQNPDVWSDAGYCLFRQGQYAQAEHHIRKASNSKPGESRYVNNLALIRGVQGHIDESLALFRQCHDEATAQECIAQIHDLRKDPALAKAAREKSQLAKAAKTVEAIQVADGSQKPSAATAPDLPITAAASAAKSPPSSVPVLAALAPSTELPPSPSTGPEKSASAQGEAPIVLLGHQLAMGNTPRAMEVAPPPGNSPAPLIPSVKATPGHVQTIATTRPLATPPEGLLPIIQPAYMPGSTPVATPQIASASPAPVTAPIPVAAAPAPIAQSLPERMSPTALPPSPLPPPVVATQPAALGAEDMMAMPMPTREITTAAHRAEPVAQEPAGTVRGPVARFVAETLPFTTVVSAGSLKETALHHINASRTFPLDPVDEETEDPGDAPLFIIRGQSEDPAPAAVDAQPAATTPAEDDTAAFIQPVATPTTVVSETESPGSAAPFPEQVASMPAVRRSIEPADAEWFDDRRQTILTRSQDDLFRGYCPVALREERALVDARAEFICEHNGQQISCSSAEAMKLFQMNPHCYLPVADGCDVVKAGSPAATSAPAGNLGYASWFDERLYFFGSPESLAKFQSQPEYFAQQVLAQRAVR